MEVNQIKNLKKICILYIYFLENWDYVGSSGAKHLIREAIYVQWGKINNQFYKYMDHNVNILYFSYFWGSATWQMWWHILQCDVRSWDYVRAYLKRLSVVSLLDWSELGKWLLFTVSICGPKRYRFCIKCIYDEGTPVMWGHLFSVPLSQVLLYQVIYHRLYVFVVFW